MKAISDKIKSIAAGLFDAGKIDVFIGWEENHPDYAITPYIARSKADLEHMAFNQYAIHNSSTYLLKLRDGQERIGIVVKGCDSRGIVRLLEDRQIQRERLYIIGVCCPGMKDPLLAIKAQSGLVDVKEEELAVKCQNCLVPNPVIYDELIGEKQPPHMSGERFAKVKAIENMSYDERYQFFEKEFAKCIRCYACRQACIACDCRTCIYDEMRPQWVGRETSTSDNMMYHLVKALHMAGRCIECGECERICPVDIPLMLINNKLAKDANHFFGPYEAGMSYVEGQKPALSVYREDDPDDFI